MPPGLAILGGGLLAGGLSYMGAKKAASGATAAAGTAAQSQIQGAEIAAQSQRESLAYLKEREAVPQHLREQALQKLGGVYGIQSEAAIPPIKYTPSSGGMLGGLRNIGGRGGEAPSTEEAFSQQDLIDQARQSPLYGSIMGGQKAGEESIGRHASMTGGLRSGNIQDAFYDYNTTLQNKALLESYNQQLQGLQGLAGLPSNANQIAQTQAGIGQTLGQGVTGAGQSRAQGQVASGQAWQQGLGNIGDIALGGIGTAIKYGII